MQAETPLSLIAEDGGLMRLVLQADPFAVREGLAMVRAAPLLNGISTDCLGTTEIVLAEVLNNIVEHAYPDGLGEIDVTLHREPTRLAFRIEDRGRPMPGGMLPAGHLVDLSGEIPEGGFGWHMIRTLSEGLSYRREDDRNLLCFAIPMQQSAA